MTEPHPKIILASQSPRRRYLLERAGLKFKVVPSAVDEASVVRSDPAEYVRALAEAKAGDIAGRYPESWVIGADTVVVVAGRVLGKPASRAEAADMLRRLSGRTHQVLTGWCVCRRAGGLLHADTVCTDVVFKELSAGRDPLVHPDGRALRQGRGLRHPGDRHLPRAAHQRLLHQRGRAAGVRGARIPHPGKSRGVRRAAAGSVALEKRRLRP